VPSYVKLKIGYNRANFRAQNRRAFPSMKVFWVQPIVKNGNYVFRDVIASRSDRSSDLWYFDGTTRGDEWRAAERRADLLGGKRKRIGDFLACTPGSAFAMVDLVDSDAARIIRGCGELLPVTGPVGAPPISIVNIAPTTDALDATSSIGYRYPGLSAIWLERPSFRPGALPRRSLFKVPEDTWKIFAVQGTVPPEDDFKSVVETNGYAGLEFREVWNDDGDPVETISFATQIFRTSPR
jgi:hypothetical protein